MKRIKNIPWAGILAFVAVVTTGSWFADLVKELLLEKRFSEITVCWQFFVIVTVFLLLLGSLWLLYLQRGKLVTTKTIKQSYLSKGKKGLIVFLSTPNPVPENWSFPLQIGVSTAEHAVLEGVSLNNDIEALKVVRWNWQQLLIGLKPHFKSLKYLYLVGSAESGSTKASFDFLGNAEALVKQYFPKVIVFKSENPVKFEDLEELLEATEQAIKLLIKKRCIEEDEIVIDITGGQKTTSIVGALVTLNSEIIFQYVDTNSLKVWGYDVVNRPPVSM